VSPQIPLLQSVLSDHRFPFNSSGHTDFAAGALLSGLVGRVVTQFFKQAIRNLQRNSREGQHLSVYKAAFSEAIRSCAGIESVSNNPAVSASLALKALQCVRRAPFLAEGVLNAGS